MDREISAWKRELRRNPGSIAFARLAERLREAGRLDEATWVCARGLATNPDYATGHAILGEILLEGNLNERAEEEFSLGIQLDGFNVRARIGLATLLLAKGNRQAVIEQLEQVLFWQPTHERARELVRQVHAQEDSQQADTLLQSVQQPETPPPPESQPDAEALPAPPGLVPGREAELARLLIECETLNGSIVINKEGLPVASEGRMLAFEDSVVVALNSLCVTANRYLQKLGFGALESCLLEDAASRIRLLRYKDYLVGAALNQEAKLGRAEVEIKHAVTQLDRRRKIRAGDIESIDLAPENSNA